MTFVEGLLRARYLALCKLSTSSFSRKILAFTSTLRVWEARQGMELTQIRYVGVQLQRPEGVW